MQGWSINDNEATVDLIAGGITEFVDEMVKGQIRFHCCQSKTKFLKMTYLVKNFSFSNNLQNFSF